MPRAYTKSGSIEKYENSQWSIYWKGNTGTCTGPDASIGEYTITAPAGMSITSTKNDTSYCLTIYGGIQNWFYFERNTIYISCGIYLTKNIATCYRTPNTTDPNSLEYQFLKANKVIVSCEWNYNEGGYWEVGDTATFTLDPDNATLTQTMYLSNKSYIQHVFFDKSFNPVGYITKETGTWTYNGVTYNYEINC